MLWFVQRPDENSLLLSLPYTPLPLDGLSIPEIHRGELVVRSDRLCALCVPGEQTGRGAGTCPKELAGR